MANQEKNNYFGKGKETIQGKTWDWETFQTTEGFPISDKLLDWVVGQDRVLDEVRLALDEWIYKLKWLQAQRWYKGFLDPYAEKSSFNKLLTPGPYLLLLGDPGTGKSLIGRAMAEHLTQAYKKHKIKRFDVLCWRNKVLPGNPKISVHPAGKGKELARKFFRVEQRKSWGKTWGIRILMGLIGGFGISLLSISIMDIINWAPRIGIADALIKNALLLSIAGSMLFFMFFIWQISKMLGGNFTSGVDISGASRSDAPKLLVDNSNKSVPFVDATGHTSAQLFGSIAWDPYQCLSEDTRVYTKEGFKDHENLKVGDEVLSLNPETRKLEWASIESIFRKQVQENLLEIRGQRVSLLVTKDHKQLIEEGNTWVYARDLERKHLPTTYRWESKIEFPELIMKLLGWYLTEGHPRKDRKYIRITQTKENTRQEIIELLQKHNIKHYIQKKDITITEPWVYDLCMECGHGSYKKFIPRKYLEAGEKSLRVLWETMMKGDGNGRVYFTQSKSLMEQFAELSIKLGYSVTISDKENKYVSTGHSKKFIKKKHIKEIPYSGIIFSPHLSKNHFYLIEREGRLNFTGNTGGLGTPEHQRVTAGDVHRASMGILYIDEIKNLNALDAITLLSVMEDGCLPVTMRGMFHGADTAAMAVSTEPIPALFFLLAAGNFDSINQIHPALMDRLVGYGRVVRMNNDMPNTVENRRKYIQFIAQEASRFHLPPFSKEACIEIIEEGRRRSGKRDALVTKFRPLISVIKTAGTLARNENKPIVERDHVIQALENHCKTIQRQLLEHQVQERGKLLEIDPHGSKLGTIYGLAVVSDPVSGEMTGSVLRVKGQLCKKRQKNLHGYYRVTGMAKDATWMADSAEKVRSVLIKKYGIDIAQDYFTHLDFSQAYGVDGPSAGVTMAILLASLLEGKPIRQDVAVTGEINISSEDKIEITAVGGIHEKIKAAEAWGFKKVVIPLKNFKYSIKESDYNIEVVGAETLNDYLKEVLVEECGDKTGNN